MAITRCILDMDRVRRQEPRARRAAEPVVSLAPVLEIFCRLLPRVVSVLRVLHPGLSPLCSVRLLTRPRGQVLEGQSDFWGHDVGGGMEMLSTCSGPDMRPPAG